MRFNNYYDKPKCFGNYIYFDVYSKDCVVDCHYFNRCSREIKRKALLKKPPLRLMPEWLHKEQRVNDILDAIMRYHNEKLKIPIEWIEEYNKLTE